MGVDTRAHITSPFPQEQAVLRRYTRWETVNAHYGKHHRVAIQGHSGDEIRMSLAELGSALRALSIRPVDLGYLAPRKATA